MKYLTEILWFGKPILQVLEEKEIDQKCKEHEGHPYFDLKVIAPVKEIEELVDQ